MNKIYKIKTKKEIPDLMIRDFLFIFILLFTNT